MATTLSREDTGMDKIRVLVVDDHPIVRQGTVTFVSDEEDMEVVGQAANGLEALALAEQTHPDVILMDLAMPIMDGVAATREVRVRFPGSKVIVLTSFVCDEHILPALQAGAAGYLSKDISSAELASAIRQAKRGETPLSPGVARRLVEGLREPRDEEQERLASLSAREREVLGLIGRGWHNKQIAIELSISEKTVKFHVSGLLNKLCLCDRTQAALFAVRQGLVEGFGSRAETPRS